MQVRVLCFGILREVLGAAEQTLELAPGSETVGGLLDAVEHRIAGPAAALLPRVAVAVNQQYAAREHVLHEDDEVALLPPVSGGSAGDAVPQSMAQERVLLTRAPLATDAVIRAAKAASDGAVVVFDGIVRDNTRGRKTEYLLYEAYEPMALAGMRELVREACSRFAVREAVLHHRLGRLEIGETSVLIVVASAHRGAAFDACRWIIDTLKKTVPIWKQEFFTDGAVWADGEPFPEALLPGAGV